MSVPNKLLVVIQDTIYQLEKARMWNGVDWKYNPLHPILYVPVLEKLRETLKEYAAE